MKPSTPELTEGNSIVEIFISMLVQIIHVAKVEGRNMKVEICRRLKLLELTIPINRCGTIRINIK